MTLSGDKNMQFGSNVLVLTKDKISDGKVGFTL